MNTAAILEHGDTSTDGLPSVQTCACLSIHYISRHKRMTKSCDSEDTSRAHRGASVSYEEILSEIRLEKISSRRWRHKFALKPR